MTKLLITAVLIALPTYLYAWLVRSIDRFEKEPPAYLVAAFLWGALPAVTLALIFQVSFSVPVAAALGEESLEGQFLMAAIAAPVSEEIFKGLMVAILYNTRRREFDGWVDGIVYGATAGFGFAYVENVLYLMGTETTSQWVGLFFLRVVILGFMHGFWTALTGIGFGLARHMQSPWNKALVISGGLIAAIAAHLIHNGALVLADQTEGLTVLVAIANYLLLSALLIVLSFVAKFRDRTLLRSYLHDEVPDVLSRSLYEALCSKLQFKTLARLGLDKAQQRELVQTTAELAQKKLQLQKMGEEGGNSAEINQLRIALKKQCDQLRGSIS